MERMYGSNVEALRGFTLNRGSFTLNRSSNMPPSQPSSPPQSARQTTGTGAIQSGPSRAGSISTPSSPRPGTSVGTQGQRRFPEAADTGTRGVASTSKFAASQRDTGSGNVPASVMSGGGGTSGGGSSTRGSATLGGGRPSLGICERDTDHTSARPGISGGGAAGWNARSGRGGFSSNGFTQGEGLAEASFFDVHVRDCRNIIDRWMAQYGCDAPRSAAQPWIYVRLDPNSHHVIRPLYDARDPTLPTLRPSMTGLLNNMTPHTLTVLESEAITMTAYESLRMYAEDGSHPGALWSHNLAIGRYRTWLDPEHPQWTVCACDVNELALLVLFVYMGVERECQYLLEPYRISDGYVLARLHDTRHRRVNAHGQPISTLRNFRGRITLRA